MKKIKFTFCIGLCITLISCDSEVNRPEIRESTINYTLEDIRYSKRNDSISILKSNWSNYRLDILKDSISYYAIWTDRIRTTTLDSNHSEIDNILNSMEFTDGLIARFLLDSTGDIDSLINWPEVKSRIDSMTSIYMELNGFSTDEIDHIKPFLNSYQSKENMMNSLFKGFGIFHNFYSIDADFSDTLLRQSLSATLNLKEGTNEAEIRINHPTIDLVDYIVTTEYTTASDQNFLNDLEKMSGNEVDFSKFNKVHVIDTIYYRFNSDLQELVYVYAKRKMAMDTLQLFHEITIEKEGW